MVFDISLFTLSITRYVSRQNWSNPGEEVAPSTTVANLLKYFFVLSIL